MRGWVSKSMSESIDETLNACSPHPPLDLPLLPLNNVGGDSIMPLLLNQAIASSFHTTTTPRPRFALGQQVQFCGGTGLVTGYQPVAQTWTYAIEMELGPLPTMGRIGSETTILLSEAELQEAEM
jgi:hypothetical protein